LGSEVLESCAGLEKDDVKVTLVGDRTLEISGERTREEEKNTDTWHRVERSHGKFLRRFRLPENANVEAINAKVQNGVLTVTIPKTPKKPEHEAKVVKVE
jgi:HSP20 family protein